MQQVLVVIHCHSNKWKINHPSSARWKWPFLTQSTQKASTINNNQHENNNTQRQSSVGNDEKNPNDKCYACLTYVGIYGFFLLLQNRRTPESFLRNSGSLRYKAKTIPSFRLRLWWPPRPPTTHQVRKVSRRKKGCRINGPPIRWKNGQKNR